MYQVVVSDEYDKHVINVKDGIIPPKLLSMT